jgi:hypothetical protein
MPQRRVRSRIGRNAPRLHRGVEEQMVQYFAKQELAC